MLYLLACLLNMGWQQKCATMELGLQEAGFFWGKKPTANENSNSKFGSVYWIRPKTIAYFACIQYHDIWGKEICLYLSWRA